MWTDDFNEQVTYLMKRALKSAKGNLQKACDLLSNEEFLLDLCLDDNDTDAIDKAYCLLQAKME